MNGYSTKNKLFFANGIISFSYKERMSKLEVEPENVLKVVPNRITAMAVHPSCEKTIVCAGDKWGNVGFWDVVRHFNLRQNSK